jgi:membrane protease YdiL (CAAX protease family)
MLKSLDRTWIRISLYYSIALAIAACARFWWHTNDPADPAWGAFALYRHLLTATGPLLGALAVWAAFRPKRRMSLGGTFPPMAWAMIAVPAAVMAAKGLPNSFGIEPHLFGLHIGVWIAAYALLEETGWRGYLQDEFRHRPALLRYAIVGLFWYGWHFSWLGGHGAGSELANLALLVAASIGIGFIADRTRSILAAAALHVIGDVLGLAREFTTLIPSTNDRLIVVGICLASWLVMLRLWGIRDRRRRMDGVSGGATIGEP